MTSSPRTEDRSVSCLGRGGQEEKRQNRGEGGGKVTDTQAVKMVTATELFQMTCQSYLVRDEAVTW